MGQYSILTPTQGDIVLRDATRGYRLQVRATSLNIDRELTTSGFNGVKDTDWEMVESYKDPLSSRNKFRIGARGPSWCIDHELTVLSFSGVENTDWSNIEEQSYKLGGMDASRTDITADETDITSDRI